MPSEHDPEMEWNYQNVKFLAEGNCNSGCRNVITWTAISSVTMCDSVMDTIFSPSLLRLSKKPGDTKAKKSKQVSQKYTAARLHEKGVLIEIEDLQTNQ
jgi:hypothetical protein